MEEFPNINGDEIEKDGVGGMLSTHDGNDNLI
jgi:hypothetical protein